LNSLLHNEDSILSLRPLKHTTKAIKFIGRADPEDPAEKPSRSRRNATKDPGSGELELSGITQHSSNTLETLCINH
jgi:hypothetical protein